MRKKHHIVSFVIKLTMSFLGWSINAIVAFNVLYCHLQALKRKLIVNRHNLSQTSGIITRHALKSLRVWYCHFVVYLFYLGDNANFSLQIFAFPFSNILFHFEKRRGRRSNIPPSTPRGQ